MKKVAFASFAALTFATPAVAADFDGFRAEVRAGFDRVGVGADYDDGVDALSVDDNEEGVGFGAEVGYDALVGSSFVLGAYAGVDFSTAEYCTEVYGLDEGCIEAGRNFTVGIRAGAPVGSTQLLYVKGGYSNGSVDVSYEDFENILDDFSVSEERGGFHLGAGGEFAVSSNLYAKVEYVYTNYNGAEFDSPDFSGRVDSDRHQVMLGAGFRF